MTVQSDLQKAIAACEAAKGSYSMMSQSTEDQSAKQMYKDMRSDIEKHLNFLNSRLSYLTQSNNLNQNQ